MTSEQKAKLAQMWGLFFNVIDNPEQAKNGKIADAAGSGEEQTQGMSKEDKAKAAKSHQEEQEALQSLFKTHGVQEFYDQFWFLCGPDVPDMIMLKFLRARKVRCIFGLLTSVERAPRLCNACQVYQMAY